jgi:hypothetical protein
MQDSTPDLITPAMQEFIAFAIASRPDWKGQGDELAKAFGACKAARWSWPRTVGMTWRIMCVVGSTPDDIVAAAGPLAVRIAADHG